MTEVKWLGCRDPKPMLELVRDKASGRKMRLFAVACCRRTGQLFPSDHMREMADVAEGFADAIVSRRKLLAAERKAIRIWERAYDDCQSEAEECGMEGGEADGGEVAAADVAQLTVSRELTTPVVSGVAERTAEALAFSAVQGLPVRKCRGAFRSAVSARQKEHAAILRDLLGTLPFRPMSILPACLTSTAIALARSIYDDRAFDRLPIFADALEDAGCDNADILDHCRGPGPHARGCWVVDLLLGKT
jgi:hypothetical protein